MSRTSDQPGCGTILIYILIICCGYVMGLAFLGHDNPFTGNKWWHYFAALPVGLTWVWIMYFGGFVFLLTWFLVPVGGGFLTYFLLQAGYYLTTSAVGLGFVVIGVICSTKAAHTKSRPLAFNGLTALVTALVMIIAGLVKHFGQS